MKWNVYILMGAMIFEGILYSFYKYRKGLPSIKNKIFEKMLILVLISGNLNFILTVLDINLYLSYQHARMLNFFNVIYFILYELIFLYMFMYGINNKGRWVEFKKYKNFYVAPFAISVILIAISPWTHWLFQVTYNYPEMGFSRGRLFEIIPAVPMLYAVLYFSLKNKKEKNHRQGNKSTHLAIAISFLGVFINYYFTNVLLIEFFLSIALLIMYIAMENPEFYHWESTDIYNISGFLALVGEYVMEKKRFYCCGIKITNYSSLKSFHGSLNVYYVMIALAKWINKNLENGYVFYTNNQCFVIVSEEEVNLENLFEKTQQRFRTPFKTWGSEVFLKRMVFSFKDPYIFKGEKELLTSLNIALEETLNENEIFYIDVDVCRKINRKVEISKLVHEKIKNKDVEIYMQPVYNTISKKIEGAEALARITDRYLGVISPGEFIPLTEENGEIIELGLVVFEKTCEYIKTHDLEKMGLKFINVNISPVQLLDVCLIEDLMSIANKYEIDIKNIHFEITETNIIETDFVSDQINKLRETGASIVLDDFGKGTSNLERLLKYPFSVAKLDMMLVWSYFEGKNKIMKSVIDIFKGENLKIVAEGVEDESMVDVLAKLGCEYLQGYYFSKPLPLKEFDEYIFKFNK